MKRQFIYLPKFEKLWSDVQLSEESLRDLEIELLENPKLGSVIPGTIGLRKLRWNLPGKGKRGGVRILYVDFEEAGQTYMVSLIQKITSSDKKAINNLINEIRKNIEK